MFNFLEYPRLMLALKRKRGLVWEIAFSTKQPDQLSYLISKAISEATAA